MSKKHPIYDSDPLTLHHSQGFQRTTQLCQLRSIDYWTGCHLRTLNVIGLVVEIQTFVLLLDYVAPAESLYRTDPSKTGWKSCKSGLTLCLSLVTADQFSSDDPLLMISMCWSCWVSEGMCSLGALGIPCQGPSLGICGLGRVAWSWGWHRPNSWPGKLSCVLTHVDDSYCNTEKIRC